MRRSLLSVPLLVFCLSATAQAGPVGINLFADDVVIAFSPSGVRLVLFTYLTCYDDCDNAEAVDEITILAGPLISLTVTRDPDGNPVSSLYQYPDASVTFEDGGFFGTGSFTARVPMFQFTVVEQGGAWPFCDPFCGAAIVEEMNFVDGLFDAQLAAVFGVQQPFSGGSIFLEIDSITGTPDSPTERTAHSFHNFGRIEAEAIPEPSTAVLCLLAGAGALARRRHVWGAGSQNMMSK